MSALARLHGSWLAQLRRRRRSAWESRCAAAAEGVLARELGLAGAHELGRHFRRRLLAGQSRHGPVVVKLYARRDAGKARRAAAIQRGLAGAGVAVPEILLERTSPAEVRSAGLAIVVLRRVDGRPPRAEDAPALLAALARLNRTSPDRAPGAPALGRRFPVTAARRSLARLARAGVRMEPAVRDALLHRFEAELGPLHERTPGLLHGDYSGRNVLLDAQGRVVVLDFDDARSGCFGFDLAPALLRLRHGSFRAASLGRNRLDALLDPARHADLLATYWEAGDPGWRETFERHAGTLLLWAYVKAAGNVAAAVANSVRFRSAERESFRAEARRRWQRLADFTTRR